MSPSTTISEAQAAAVLGPLGAAHSDEAATDGAAPFPRRPVHVVYGGAHLYKADLPTKLGKIALGTMKTWGEDAGRFGQVVGARADVSTSVHARVLAKLAHAAVEATCIDFEDGYGPRPDDEEDADAVRAATELASATARSEGAAEPTDEDMPFIGIRIKSLAPATARRAIRTLDLFVTTLARATGGPLPKGFTVTLPKVTRPEEVAALTTLLEMLEGASRITPGTVGIELMVETPSALYDERGYVALPALVRAGKGRVVAAHLGAYDLTASLGVAASEQRLDHPACDAARMTMQFALAESRVAVVDGATTILPLARHKATAERPLSEQERADNARSVESAWSLHATNVRRALASGIYQGWDLHPAQLPARYGALYAFFLGERDAMSARLRMFVERATKATASGQIFDDAATGQGLLNFFLRGLACGALDDADLAATGLTPNELAERSFAKIVAARAVPDAGGPSSATTASQQASAATTARKPGGDAS